MLFFKYYQNLNEEIEDSNSGSKQYLKSLNLPQVMDEQNSQLTQPVTVQEIFFGYTKK